MIPKTEFAKILSVLAAAFPRFTLTPATIDAYYAILGDLDVDLLKAATLHYGALDTPWFPSAGQLRAVAFDLLERKQGVPSALEAWSEALKKINYYKPPQRDDFSSPLVYDALQAIGGNRVLCETTSETLPSARARFCQAYEALLQRARMETRMLPEVQKAIDQVVGRLSAGGDHIACTESDAGGYYLDTEQGEC